MLHNANGVRKGLQVQHEVVPLCTTVEPRCEIRGVMGWQSLVAKLFSEFDDRFGAEPTVEVVMEQHLRCANRNLR